ncbi:hypothetical protein F2Q68_00002568 [Brassica cretica]|uniref:Stearoyl-[acyl-carrier-protein] 9-desaturase n=1 Tax=Brassica cretica TaxID=69181 RepID=A0A8S9JCL4_BRACR|nr:hypothetical protein F2Q68_00002568 [Brassica cretica]
MAMSMDRIVVSPSSYVCRPSQARGSRSSVVSMASTIRSASTEVTNGKKLYIPPREVHVQVRHSMPPQKLEIFKSLEGWADETLLTYLKPVENQGAEGEVQGAS